MSQLMPLLITAALLLIPLVPAAVLYKVLTPPGDNRNEATGRIDVNGLPPGKIQLSFNVVGSTATYVVLLAVSILTHSHLADLAEKESNRMERAMKDNQAWMVEAPIGLKDVSGKALSADDGELKQVRIDLEPALTLASANTITFRVIPTNGRFPTARFNMPGIGLKPVVLDLNDSSEVRRDYKFRKISGIQPVWIVLGQPYASGTSAMEKRPYSADLVTAVATAQGE